MATGDTIKVIGIEKVTKDLDKLFSEFKTKRKIVDGASKKTFKPIIKRLASGAAVAEKDIAAFTSSRTGFSRKAIPKGTFQKSFRTRKRKNWLGLIISHGRGVKHDAWFWRFLEFGYIHWKDGRKKMPAGQFGRIRSILAGTQRQVLNQWEKHAAKDMKKRISKMTVKDT